MAAHDVIASLEGTTKRTEKEQILIDAFMSGEREFFIGAQLAYDILITFGVAKAPLIVDEDDGWAGEVSFSDFLYLCKRLRSRALTGHAARDAIAEMVDRSNITKWNTFYRRVLLKDFKCGIDASTINKVLKKIAPTVPDAADYIIPVFSCQLAEDAAKHPKKISGKKLLDIKLDGARLLTVLDKNSGTIEQYTRNGKINNNFPHIKDALKPLLEMIPNSLVIDGEVVSTSFQDLMTQLNRKAGVSSESSKLAVFDIVPLGDFNSGICAQSQEERHAVLSALDMSGILSEKTGGVVYVVPKLMVDLDTEEGQAAFKEFNKQAIEANYEGVMLKDPYAPYACRRSFNWLKLKPFIEVTLTVDAVNEGEAGAKYEGTFGSFTMSGEEDGERIVVDVGNGFTDAERDEIWAARDEWIGIMGEVRADAITKDRSTGVSSLRFARWKGRRGFEKGEKL